MPKPWTTGLCALAPALALAIIAASWPTGVGRAAEGPEPPDRRERACVPAREGERFEVDFDAIPLGTLARLVSCAAEMNLLFEPSTLSKRAVTVLAPRPVDRAGLVALFVTVLGDQGLVMSRRGAYHVIRVGAVGG